MIEKIKAYIGSGRATYILLLGTSFWLPMHRKYLPFFISLTFLFFLLQRKPKYNLNSFFSNKPLVLLLVFYLLHIVSLLYTSDLELGLFDLQLKLSLLIFPLIFLFGFTDIGTKKRKHIFNAFVIGNFIASLICLSIAFYRSIQNGGDELFNASIWLESKDWPFWKLVLLGYSFFNYTHLSFFHNPAYFGLYLLFAIYLVYFILKNEYTVLSIFAKLFYLISLVLFVVMILLLQARAAILAGLVIMIFELFRSFYIGKPKRLLRIIFTSSGLMVILLVVFFAGRFNFIHEKSDFSIEKLEKSNIRFELWNSSIEIIRKNWITGVGVGDVKRELTNNYLRKNLINKESKYLNAHNQYFETFLAIGILGFVMILFICFNPFLNQSNYFNNPIRLIFALLIIVGFTFESTLNTLAGVSFFSYFYSLLNINNTSNDTILSTKN